MAESKRVKEDRESFFARLQPVLCTEDFIKMQVAYELAKSGLRYLDRKGEVDEEGEPVRAFEHARRVTLVLIDIVKIVDIRALIESILHDGDEDTRLMKVQTIGVIFGKDIARGVRILSKQDLGPGTKDVGYFDRLVDFGEWIDWVIKLCDRYDNLCSLDGCEPDFIEKQLNETREKYFKLYELAIEHAPDRHRANLVKLYGLAQKKVGQLEAILATKRAAQATA